MQRLRVASGAPFARGSATSMSTIQQHSHHKISESNDGQNAYPADFRNQRNSSNVSRGGGPGRLSTGLTAAAAGSHHIHGSLPSAPLGKKLQHGSSASKSTSQMNGQIVNQRPTKIVNSRPQTNQRDISITSGHSSSSYNNALGGGALSLTSYQKVRTTQPQSVKHATEPYNNGPEPGPRVADMGKVGAPRGSDAGTDDLV